ncbi:tau-tubulin kinase 1 [Anaeramoeba flamelloides]|uniref:non-specific serine/threonine protein kinase n=1 Tax=Anaeramoeba flamelloides TaxID=1746091 RepID=A0ABQ8YPP7_9EUKA|nr:tau-tubulin kinase 1 [Anaeramoeba flamelloides]
MLKGSIKGRWKLGKRIGKGGFGEIYISRDLKTRKQAAIKFEKIDKHKQALKLEIAVLQKLQVSSYVPKFIYCGRNLEYNYLIMELLGTNLSVERRKRPEQKFSLATTIKLGIEMINSMEDMHKLGFIHRDIKPSNYVLRRRDPLTKHNETSSKSVICMIDFGLSRRYRHRDGNLRPPRPKVGFRGTARYASVHSHEGKELSRRDDLWSLLYLFVEFLKGELPWSPIKDKLIIYKLKKKFNSPSLVKGLPKQFLKMLEHIQSSKYEDTPNYNYLRKLLKEAYDEAGYDESTMFDWEIEKSNHSNVKKHKRHQPHQRNQRNQRNQLNQRNQVQKKHKKDNNQKSNQKIFDNKNGKKYKNLHKKDQKDLNNGTLESNGALPYLTKTPNKRKKKKRKILSKKFLQDIQKMNEIVIPSREELKKRQKIKGFTCLQQKRESPKIDMNPKKVESDFFDLIEANPRNEIYNNGPNYALMIQKIEEDLEMDKEKEGKIIKKHQQQKHQQNVYSSKKEKPSTKNSQEVKNKVRKKNDQPNLNHNSNPKKKDQNIHGTSNFDFQNNSSESVTIDKKSCRCVIQ